jgi:hypothetical protein
MTPDRLIANAIADGINSVAELATAVQKGDRGALDTTSRQHLDALEAMEQAYEAILKGGVATSLHIVKDDVERIRRTRALVSEWVQHGRSGEELGGTLDTILMSVGLPAVARGEDAPTGTP